MSDLAKHSIQKDHKFFFDEYNLKILTSESNQHKRKFKEACKYDIQHQKEDSKP